LKRRWSIWLPRLISELNGTNGLAGAGGLTVSAAGLTIFSGTASTVLTALGLLIGVSAVGYAVYKSIPPKLRNAEDVVGEILATDELDGIHPPIKKLAIIGIGQAGKTTLRDRLSFDVSKAERTQQVTAKIVSLHSARPTYLAILDGGGEKYAQQFKIAEIADCLCVVLDHNSSDTSKALSKTRVAQHRGFLSQVKHHLNEAGCEKKNWTRFLVNKHDLWKLRSSAERSEITEFAAQEAEKWQAANLSEHVDYVSHSNAKAQDIAEFMTYLRINGK